MNVAEKLGRLLRREATIVGIGDVRARDAARLDRLGASSAELNQKFAAFTDRTERRLAFLERRLNGEEGVAS